MKTTIPILSAIVLCACLQASSAAMPPPPPEPMLPLAGIAYQTAEANPTKPLGSIIAFASSFGASHIEQVSFIPVDELHADSDNYRSLWLMEVDTNGDFVGGPIFATTTQPSGTGDWTAGRAAVSVTIDYTLPAGHTLMGTWRPNGGGTPLPGGAWRVE